MQRWPESPSDRSISWPKNPLYRPRGHWDILIVKPCITCIALHIVHPLVGKTLTSPNRTLKKKKKIYIYIYDVWPSMVTIQVHSHSSEHTPQWAANAAASGEQLWLQWLAQGSHLSRSIEGGENARCSLPPPTIPARPEIWSHNLRLQVRHSIH